MAIKVEHELHTRRKGRNNGVGLLLVGFVAIVFGLTIVKVLNLEHIAEFERTDHALRPQLLPTDAEVEAQTNAAPATTEDSE
ncbi:hypothetical protein [Aestuariibius sp. HNIBRBA575]|uniref:hypothetical protein n=1 Tax=Aestuariibius sp. HNIBRBA575 TaxID=3233343 RepID=UPI0034A246CD